MKKILLYSFLAIVLLAIVGFGYAYSKLKQNIHIPPLTEVASIDDIIKSYIDNEMTKGLSIGTFKNGKVEFFNFGICSEENQVKPTENSIYEIGSITKTFTGAVLAEMVAEGKVNYDDPIAKYLPDSICNWPIEKAITLEDLSTHTSGLPRLPDNLTENFLADLDNPYKNYSIEKLYAFLKTYSPKTKEDRVGEYSNLGVGLLGHILAKIDGKSYGEMISDRIFKPLGMDNSTIALTKNQLTQGHDQLGYPTSQWDFQALAGAGAIRSSTKDMMKYLVEHFKQQAPFDSTQKMRRDLNEVQKIGLGWIEQEEFESGKQMMFHGGGTGGFLSFAGFFKEDNVGVIVLSNASQDVEMIGIRTLQFLAKS